MYAEATEHRDGEKLFINADATDAGPGSVDLINERSSHDVPAQVPIIKQEILQLAETNDAMSTSHQAEVAWPTNSAARTVEQESSPVDAVPVVLPITRSKATTILRKPESFQVQPEPVSQAEVRVEISLPSTENTLIDKETVPSAPTLLDVPNDWLAEQALNPEIETLAYDYRDTETESPAGETLIIPLPESYGAPESSELLDLSKVETIYVRPHDIEKQAVPEIVATPAMLVLAEEIQQATNQERAAVLPTEEEIEQIVSDMRGAVEQVQALQKDPAAKPEEIEIAMAALTVRCEAVLKQFGIEQPDMEVVERLVRELVELDELSEVEVKIMHLYDIAKQGTHEYKREDWFQKFLQSLPVVDDSVLSRLIGSMAVQVRVGAKPA